MLCCDVPQVLKIDVEGFEGAVLEGASKLLGARRVSHILLEWSPDALARAQARAGGASGGGGHMSGGPGTGAAATVPSSADGAGGTSSGSAAGAGAGDAVVADRASAEQAGLGLLRRLAGWDFGVSTEGFGGPFLSDPGGLAALAAGQYKKSNVYCTLLPKRPARKGAGRL